MAKRGCCRLSTAILAVFFLLLVAFSSHVSFFLEDAVARLVWLQDDPADYSAGALSNVEIKEHNGEAFLQLTRTGEWSNVMPATSPPPREGHSMVFDESINATVLFGGRNETTYFGDTWLFFSENSTWIEVTPPGGPSPREGQAMTYDKKNELVIMFGGYDGSNYYSDTWTYSARGNVWTSLNPTTHPSARAWSAMSYDTQRNSIILFGGQEKYQQAGDTWEYELSSNTWTLLFPLTTPRERHGHSMVYDESLGVHVLSSGIMGGDAWSDVWFFNSTSMMWEKKNLAGNIMPRLNHSLVYDAIDEELYIFGGYGNSTTIAGYDRFTPLPCQIPLSDKATTILQYDGKVYIGTSNSSMHAKIYVYDPAGETCNEWMDTGVYYVYSSGEYGGVAFWGSRLDDISTLGPLFYYDGVTFGSIPASTWFSSVPVSGWVQDFEIFDGMMFVSGSLMMALPENDNNLFVKYCDNSPCQSPGDWHWTSTPVSSLGLVDDGLILEEYNGDLYLGTYDWASVMRYYPSNKTWWYALNGSVDGDTPGMKGGYGVFGLANYSGSLHALTYSNGWHWTTQDGATWSVVNESLGSFTRALVFENKLYAGIVGPSENYLSSYYGSSWSNIASGSAPYLYLSEIDGKLYVSSGNQVLRREAYHNDLWQFDEEKGWWVETADTNPPSPRSGFGLAFDSHTHVIVLFGGSDELGVYGDTYIFEKSVGSGVFTSVVFDAGDTPYETKWYTLSWSRISQPTGSSIRFQIASNNDNTTWTFRGPDGTTATFYDNPVGEDIWSGHDGDRYLRFRAYFSTFGAISPTLDWVRIAYGHVPPPPTLEYPLDDIWIEDDSPRFTWTFDDFDTGETQSGFQVLVSKDIAFSDLAFDSGPQENSNEYWQLPSTLSDGIWYWKVRTKDIDGLWGEYSSPFILKIDKTPPSSSVSNLGQGSHLSSISMISGTGIDNHSGPKSVEILLSYSDGSLFWNGTAWQSQESWLLCAGASEWIFDATGVAWQSEHEYSIKTRAIDNAGNVETPMEEITFIYDSTPPSLNIINPIGAESPEGGDVMDIQWTVTDPYLNQSSIRISYSLDGGSTWNLIAENEDNDGSYNWTLPRMKADMRIKVEAMDLARNTGFDMSGVFYVRVPEREENWLTEYWWIVIIILASLVMAYYFIKRPVPEEPPPPPIVATARETTLCSVCLGTVKQGLSIIRCGECGKNFHEKCAARIEKCPNCDSRLDTSELVEE